MSKNVVCAGLIEKNDKFVLVQEDKASFKGMWGLPAGRLRNKENLHDCITREVEEETGLNVEPTGIVGVYIKWEKNDLTVVIVYSMGVSDETVSADHYDVQDVDWFTIDEIESLNLRSDYITQAISDYYEREHIPTSHVERVGSITPGIIGRIKLILVYTILERNIIRGLIKGLLLVSITILVGFIYGFIKGRESYEEELKKETYKDT